jgi:hypothetical protein
METNSSSRKRARTQEGQFKGNSSEAPDINEAWEPVALEPNKYAVKQKITPNGSKPMIGATAKVTPNFNRVDITTY